MKKTAVKMIGGIPKINGGLFGEGGSGKTTLLAGFAQDPRTSPALWLNAIGNPQKLVLNDSIPWSYDIEDFREVDKVIDFIATGQKPKHPLRRELGLPEDLIFRSLIVDTMTGVQEQITQYVAERNPSNVAPGLFKVEALKHGAEIGGTTLKMVRDIMALPIHTFLSYQLTDRMTTEGESKVVYTAQLGLYGSSRAVIPPWHNLMGLVKVQQKKELIGGKPSFKDIRVVLWQDADAVGKNQLSPTLGDRTEEATAEKILNAIEADWKAKAQLA